MTLLVKSQFPLLAPAHVIVRFGPDMVYTTWFGVVLVSIVNPVLTYGIGAVRPGVHEV